MRTAAALVLVGTAYYLVTQVITVRQIQKQWSRLPRMSLGALLPGPTPTVIPTPTQTAEARPTPTRIPTATPAPSPAPTASPTAVGSTSPMAAATQRQAVAVPAAPSVTATPAFRYPAVKLLAPADGTVFDGGEVSLSWQPVGELAADEWYGVSLRHWASDRAQYGGAWVRETSWRVPAELRTKPDPARPGFQWDVTVMKRAATAGGGSEEVALSPASETRTFRWR